MANTITLDEVVKNAVREKQIGANNQVRVEQFKTACTALITEMRQWLNAHVEAKLVIPNAPQKVSISEFGIAYEADCWSFNIGAQRVDLRPRGTWVIGAYGRVDMIGYPGNLEILTLNEDFNWEISKRGKTKVTYSLLSEANFPEALSRALSIS